MVLDAILPSAMVQSGTTALVEYAVGSTLGACREVNEDAYGAFEAIDVFVVVDGCGGRSSAESAAWRTVAQFAQLGAREGLASKPAWAEADPLAVAVLQANADVYHDGMTKAHRAGQGAALCAVRVSATMVTLTHVGDCRVGRHRDGRLAWLTEDHSLAAELRRSGAMSQGSADAAESHANVITRAVGVTPDLVVDLSYHPVACGDTFLLCTDGLTAQLDYAGISAIMGGEGGSLSERCAALLDATEAAGGYDNATVVLFRLLT